MERKLSFLFLLLFIFMEKTEITKSLPQIGEETKDEWEEILLTLPKERNWTGNDLYLYQGFWCPCRAIKAVISFQRHLHAHNTDLILGSAPKSGTTWLKAHSFAIVNRTAYSLNDSPLLTKGPHELVPFIEFDFNVKNQSPNLDDRPRPRIFSTHTPYPSLPPSIKDSNCRIVYVCRNPLDQLISYWHFMLELRCEDAQPVSLDEGFEKFCLGIHGFGPFWEHVLGYWKARLERPHNVLFLQYEDLKEDIIFHTKRLAEFLGFPFTNEEEKQGVIEKISKLCSFENLKILEVNKTGKCPSGLPNSVFFRKGEVRDWANYLTPSITDRMEKLMEQKFEGSGLSFKLSSKVQKDI